MSFDPYPVTIARETAPTLPRGIVAERHYDDAEWAFLSPKAKRGLARMTHAMNSRPQFIAYHVNDLPGSGSDHRP